jgi:hypothetical protein
MKSKISTKALIVLLLLALATAARPQNSQKRTITVKFDYDFRLSPACSTTSATKKCIKLFNVYDVTGGKREWLFSVPTPAQASGNMKGITATSPALTLAPGKHTLAVTARSADDAESETNVCTTTIDVSAH